MSSFVFVPNDLELLAFVKVQEKDLALRIEVVGESGELSLHRVLNFHARNELSSSGAPPAREGPPRRAVVSAAFAVRALPKTCVTDSYSSSHQLFLCAGHLPIASYSGKQSALR